MKRDLEREKQIIEANDILYRKMMKVVSRVGIALLLAFIIIENI